MTVKTLHVKVSLPLHEDELDAAEQKVGAKNFKVAIADLVTMHLPGAVVSHEIASPEPEKKVRKSRMVEVKPTGLAFDPTKPEVTDQPAKAGKKAA